MSWAGFEVALYPGDDVMRLLWQTTPLAWTSLRLGPTAGHPDASWMQAYPALIEQGWGIAPVYVRALPADADAGDPSRAEADAAEAVALAKAAGLPAGSALFVDVGEGNDLAVAAYVELFVEALVASGYEPGVRASAAVAERFAGAQPPVALWIAGGGPSPAAAPSNVNVEAPFWRQPSPRLSTVEDAVIWRHTSEADSPALTGGGIAGVPAFNISAAFSSAVLSNPLAAASAAVFASPGAGRGGTTTPITITGSPFPFAPPAISFTPGGPKGSSILSIEDALAEARKAKRIGPKLKVAVVDMTDGGFEYGGLHDDDSVFAASLLKINALAAAIGLRAAVSAAIKGHTAAVQDLLPALESTWKSTVQATYPGRPKDFPQLSRIFAITPRTAAGTYGVTFKSDDTNGGALGDLDLRAHDGDARIAQAATATIRSLSFFDRLRLMAQDSNNVAAASCIRDLGFHYIMSAMVHLGLASATTEDELWLAKDYAGGTWGTVGNFHGQRATARAVATYFAAFASNQLFPAPALTAPFRDVVPLHAGDTRPFTDSSPNLEIGAVLQGHRTVSFIEDGVNVSIPPGDPAFDIHCAKIGLYEMSDLPPEFGPATEGGYFERTRGAKRLKYAVAILSGSKAEVGTAAAAVDKIIVDRNS
jgi:hypothetical protein